MSRTDVPRLAILGAGPVGLEAALYAARLGLSVRVYERGSIGGNVRVWGHVRLFSPFGMNTTPLGRAVLRADNPRVALPADGDLLTGRDHVSAYLEPLSRSPGLAGNIETETTVLAIGRQGYLKEERAGDPSRARQPFCLLVKNKNAERIDLADVVLDCTGIYGNARNLGESGIPAVGELGVRAQIAWGIEDVLGEKRTHYADRNILVVGGGHSAATTVGLLASLAQQHPSTWIVWLSRGVGSQPIRRIVNDPLRERDQVAARANMLATRGEGHVEFHAQAVVTSIAQQGKEGFVVGARVAGSARNWEVDRVIANVGFEPDNRLYRELQVQECPTSLAPLNLGLALGEQASRDCLTVTSPGAAALRTGEPNFFVLGSKSYGRHTNFLLRTGFEQVREVFSLIKGKPDLDLYRAAR